MKEIEVIDEIAERIDPSVVRPDQIPLSGEMSGPSSFGIAEIEETAGHLIQFFQLRGHWCRFTIDELRRFYELKGWNPNLMFSGLIGGHIHMGGMSEMISAPREIYIAMDEVGNCYVTKAFIGQCMGRKESVAA
ncbi:MAG TPA: hypothetical protein VG753_03125 [Candidatus Paceibacterota bacterium]|nr:hypothetical protein [Candidatus Paceibacterota bacterium]